MTLTDFLHKIRANEAIDFAETMAIISDNYCYQATEFSNGLGEEQIINAAGTNEGSCKIFSFALIHQLDQQQTLDLFGDYYRLEVLPHQEGTGHQNIRLFMRYGWEGIVFKTEALTPRANDVNAIVG